MKAIASIADRVRSIVASFARVRAEAVPLDHPLKAFLGNRIWMTVEHIEEEFGVKILPHDPSDSDLPPTLQDLIKAVEGRLH